jgi:hypothetical protein
MSWSADQRTVAQGMAEVVVFVVAALLPRDARRIL